MDARTAGHRTLLVVPALVVLVGCAAQGGGTSTSEDPESAAPRASTTAPPATSTTPPSGGSTSPSPGAAPGAEVSELTVFRSPTGNIVCAVNPDAGHARCDIGETDWAPPPEPADCELDYGSSLFVDATGAGFACVGDAPGEPERVLGYGQALQGGGVRCTSAETGMTCEHLRTGHRFSLSRGSYSLG